MTSYELGNLNDKEFEALAAQMVGVINNVRVERFKPGKDRGVDGRFYSSEKQEIIVQAKQWTKTGTGPLLARLEKEEASKVARLSPARYVFVTSVPLSHADKKRVRAIFEPFIKSDADIFGNEDVQDFLRDHANVVQNYYKLWLASAEVLKLIQHAAIIGRSTAELDKAVAFSRMYVVTRSHTDALDRLKEKGSIIIIGEPGIGKSTLAEQLLLQCAADSYEVCVVQDTLGEAEGVWSKDKKQVFYFDDFLGTNYLEAIDRKLDSHVVRFMRRVENDKTKRFILTSRTTILQQGKNLSDIFRAENIDQKEYEIRITALKPIDKARILYNHIWFGDLGQDFVEQVYVNKRYREIIKHRNFNPRLIAFITDSHKIAGVTPEKYWNYIEETLENPSEIWRSVFERQIDRMGRLIVALVVFNGIQIYERSLRDAIARARLAETAPPSAAEWSIEFERSLRMCVGAVISRVQERANGVAFFCLFNPSVGDYVLRQYAQNPETLENLLSNLKYGYAVDHFSSLLRNGIVTPATFRRVVGNLGRGFLREPFEDPRFLSSLVKAVLLDSHLATELEAELRVVAGKFFAIADESGEASLFSRFAEYCLTHEFIARDAAEWKQFVTQAVDGVEDDDPLVEISKVIALLDEPLRLGVTDDFTAHVVEVWREKIEKEVDRNSVATDQTDSNDEGQLYDAQSEVHKYVRSGLDDYAIKFDDFEVSRIVEIVNISERLDGNLSRNRSNEEGEGWSGGSGSLGGDPDDTGIDDLFDRTP